MKLNRQLAEQIKELLPPALQNNEQLRSFLTAVNNSYNSYEKEIDRAKKRTVQGGDDHQQLKDRLECELKQKRASFGILKHALAEISEVIPSGDNDDSDLSLFIADYLKKQKNAIREKDNKLHNQRQFWQFYERIFNCIPADIAIIDRSRTYQFVNPHAIKDPELRKWMIGKTEEEFAAYRGRSEAATRQRITHFEDTVASRVQSEWEETIVNRQGKTEHHLRMLYPVYDEKGEFDIMVIYGLNITERKEALELLRKSEERYKSIFNNTQALICTHKLDGTIIDANTTCVDVLGYSAEELQGASLYKLLQPDKRAEYETNYLADIIAQGVTSGIMVALDRWGKKIYLLYKNYLVDKDADEPYVVGISQDITSRIEAERALKKSEVKYRNIIANMNLGLLEVDDQEMIVFANNSFTEMSGYELDELVGKKASKIFFKEDEIDNSNAVTEMRRLGHTDVYEKMVHTKGGDQRWWLISGAPSYDKNGNFKGSIGIHLDITVQKTLEQALRKAKSDVERSAQSKDIFLANMSHEIRTPMNAILGIENLLSKTNLDAKQRHYLSTIQNATNNLLVIINDLLDFSKIEAGKISIEHVGFELRSLLDSAVVILKYKAAEKSLFISAHCSPDVAPVLIGDPYRISQVLMNLLGNSIKFTEHGSVSIECTTVADDVYSQYVQFKITDTGIGMSKEFISLLFDKFEQEDESITRKFGGTGLGMSICKELVELMGGEIKVESKKNVGTTISFILGFAKGTPEDIPEKEEYAIDNHVFKDKRILLVEDNEANRLIANTIFSNHGADVIEAENGEVAIRKFAEGDFDIILMDVRMPVKDGLDTTRFIRAHMDDSIPIIALTASALKEEQERCRHAGMSDFISKPFNENKLVQLVGRWLGREVKVETIPVEEEVTGDELFSLSKLKIIGRGNVEFVRNMIELFIINTPQTIKDMEQAFKKGEWKSLSRLAHLIKPSVHNMGVLSLSDDLNIIEDNAAAPQDPGIIREHLDHIKAVTEEVVQHLKKILPQYMADVGKPI